MGTFANLSQTGGPIRWEVSGQNITNHEAWAFTLNSAGFNVGALISDVTVYRSQDPAPFGGGHISDPSYNITLTAVDQFANPVNVLIKGHFESDGV
jgi:hypothetical protein